jgi:hypothetical protein
MLPDKSSRWGALIDTPEQIAFRDDDVRYKVCAAGRRSGKTERAKRKIIKEAFKKPGLYFFAAPTYGQVKKIYWDDLKAFIPAWALKSKPSETELIVKLINGSEIHLIGLDKPQRIEGIPWTGGGIDEIADVKAGALHANILPAFDTVGLNTWCMFYGVPDGLNHFYDMAEYAKGADVEWGYYHWKSADILSADAIEAAQRRMPPKLYLQEYEASFETATGLVYSDYCNDNHTTRQFEKGNIYWAHDFNYSPMSSAVIQKHDGDDYVVDEISLDHATARHAAIEFIERYKDHKDCRVYVYGDPSGRAGEKHGLVSNYIEIESVLRNAGFTVSRRVFAATRSIRDGQNSLRGRVLTASGERHFFVNPTNAPTIDRGMKTVQVMKGSTYQEDETNNSQHIISAIRYYASYEYPIGKSMIYTGIKVAR